MSSRKKSRRPSLKGSLNPSKRHRDRVNVELDNLAKLLPYPPEVISKLDKLSVLRLSASYLRTKSLFKGLKSTDTADGSSTSSSDSMVDDVEKNGKLREMVLEALDGFLMVLTQEGELFYASETISDFLGVSQPSVIHQDFLRFVHADDHKILLNNLKRVPSPPEQKIRELRDDHEKAADDASCEEGGDIDRERSFHCRFKCILNTNAGFYKPFQCHGRLREMDQPDAEVPRLALFLMCSPVEITTSILEVRMKSMLFSTKNKLDLTFVDIDQKGKQIVGYTKKDITAQSSYCMMHYDDIPILKKMHEDLLATGKCEGTFRWLNKQLRWQWLTGSGQVILKNGQPDFVITTNKPLTDEEGEDEVRRRERDLGLVPTSPSSMLTHLQISDTPRPSTSSFDESLMEDTDQSLLTTDISAPPVCGPSVSSTSCASAGLSTDDLTWDFDADSLFEASGTSWVSAHASLADLDEIGKDDLVGELFHLDVQDFDFDQNPSRSEPSNVSSISSCAVQDFPPTYTQPANHHVTSSQAPALPASKQKPTPVSSPTQQQFTPPSCALSPGHQRPVNNPCSLNNNMVGPAATAAIPAYVSGPPPLTSSYHVNNVSSSKRSPLGQNGMPPLSQNGMPPLSQNGMPTLNQNGMPILISTGYLNHGGMMENQNTMQPTSAPPQPPSVQVPFVEDLVGGHQTGLLRVQVGQPMKSNSVKMEPGRFNSSAGYYCNTNGVEPRPMSDMSRMAGLSAQMNAAASNRYQNKYVNQGNLPAWAPAPPSPYSSGSSTCSSFADPLNVQFSPTEVLVSPFASPRGDNDYSAGVHNNVPAAAVLSPAGQYYPPVSANYRMVQRSRPRVPNTFAQQFVNIPEISPVGMVDDLVPGAHRVSPISTHNAGMANW